MPCAASSRSMRSSASASSPVCVAISAGEAPASPTASAAPHSAITCKQRAAMCARERSATTAAGSGTGGTLVSRPPMTLLARGSLQVDRDTAAAQVVVVGAAEIDDAGRLDLDDARRDRRDELAVMAHEYDRARIVLERQVQRLD